MNLQEQFEILVKDHDDMENDLQLAEGETFAYLRSMLPIECFLKEQQGKGLSWDYSEMRQEAIRFRKLSSTANIQISRHFRYDCSRRHTHDYFQLNYILEGRPVIHYGDENYQASPGDFFLLAPGVPHWIDSRADDILMLKVYIRYSTFENTFFRLLGEQNVLADFFRRILYEGDTRKGYLCFRTNNTASLREHMLETYRLFLNRVEYLNIILECRITELFCTLVRLYTETDPSGAEGGEPAGMGKILSYIRKQYAAATLEETAAWAGYSKNYLCRLLKNGTGKTFTEIQNAIRVEKACQMLTQTELPASEIAARTGYGSIKHFYRVFRETTGTTPNQYRQANTGENKN